MAPINDGLDPAEILALSDKDLNTIVGLRKLAPYHEGTERVRPNYKALGEARQKLRDAGLYVDKRAVVAKRQRIGVVAKGTTKGGTQREGAGSARRGTVAVAAPSGEPGKRKRPGPALRRALKAQAAPEQVPGGEAASADPAAMPSALPAAKNRKERPAPTEEDRKRQRLASYGKLEMPGKSTRGDVGAAEGGSRPRVKIQSRVSPAAADAVASLPKAARKNARRAQKRQAKRVQEECIDP